MGFAIRPVHGILIVAAIAALMLLSKPFYQVVFAFVKTAFEGNSFGKTVLFLAWLAVFFAILLLKQKGIISLKKKDSGNNLKIFAILVVASWLLAISLNTFLLSSHDAGFGDVIGTLISRDGVLEWEASLIKHLHAAKISVGFVNSILPFHISGADSGVPIYSIMPFAWLFAPILILLALGAIFLVIREALENFEGKITVRLAIWAVASYGLTVSMLDGGPFSEIGRFSIGLFFFYWLAFESGIKLSPIKQLAAAIILLGGFYFIASFFTLIQFYATTRIALLGIVIILALFAMHWKKMRMPEKAVLAVLLAFLSISLSFQIEEFAFGSSVPEGIEGNYFVYGLPEGTDSARIVQIAEKFGTVSHVEQDGWIAMFTMTADRDFRVEELDDELHSGLKPETYLYVFTFSKVKNSLLLDWPKAGSKEADALLDVNSSYISFRKVDWFGQEKIAVETMINDNYSLLYVLNYMHFHEGIESPVAVLGK